jgi:pSer/pThr/pTyr-binding forkhead associated (FHA) protein
MPKLVVLSAELNGRSHELKTDRTTIGRLEDNTFQIPESSVSSHHCEVLLKGTEVLIRDLNSTNGTFINGEKITEKVLKPGQTLRLGQIELRLENGTGTAAPAGASASAPAPGPATAPSKKVSDQTTLITQRGVNLNELDQGARHGAFDTKSTGFSKKDNKGNRIFWVAAAIVGLVIIVLLVVVLSTIK